MPKMQAITDEMKATADRIGDRLSLMVDSQKNVKDLMSSILVHFESNPKVMTALHLANVRIGYQDTTTSLKGYQEFISKAADTYEWNDKQIARWAEQMNEKKGVDIYNYIPDDSNSGVVPQNYENPEQFIWDFLLEKIGNAYGAAALMGNLFAESGLRANNLQNSYEGALGMTDDEYTAAVDNGSYDNFINDGAGYGIAQWTYYSRKQALLEFAREKGTSVGDLQTQLEFLWKELSEGYPGILNTLKTASSIREASDVILKEFERPADQSESACERRADYAEGLYSDLMA